MLFSTFLDNVPKFCAFDDSLSIERCYQSMCKSMKSLRSDSFSLFDQGHSSVTRRRIISSHRLCHQHNRIRRKISAEMSIDQRPHHNQLANKLHKRQTRSTRTAATTKTATATPSSSSSLFTFPTINAVVLFFIVLLSHDQITTTTATTVHDARSRDSSNSIYQRNNLSVNNVIKTGSIEAASAAIDTNAVANQLDIELPIESFINVTNDDEFEQLLSSRSSSNNKLRRDPIYQNEFAVYIPDGVDVADRIAGKHGYNNMGQVRRIYFVFYCECHSYWPQFMHLAWLKIAISMYILRNISRAMNLWRKKTTKKKESEKLNWILISQIFYNLGLCFCYISCSFPFLFVIWNTT